MKLSFIPEPSRFNEKKTTQAAARFLNLAGGRMNYMLLIKLLYMLDRGTLAEWGRPVTGDEYFSMKLGPVLSEVLDLITEPSEQDASGFWATHISEPSSFIVKLTSDPGDDDLSEAEEQMIERVFSKFGHFDRFVLADHLHEILPEWTKVERGRVPLPISDILKAHNKSKEDIAAIDADLSELARTHRMFGAAH